MGGYAVLKSTGNSGIIEADLMGREPDEDTKHEFRGTGTVFIQTSLAGPDGGYSFFMLLPDEWRVVGLFQGN
jgi:hypothetical protein